jgi:hypothetical protein
VSVASASGGAVLPVVVAGEREDDRARGRFERLRPDFLVISPAKTGSTWLADNLRCHPQLFVPAVKEVKYFSSYCDDFDLDWYLEHFVAAGGRLKGEASPSYALLPPARLRQLRRLLPGVKLVFLLREPLARAWSHAKHTFRYRELTFAAGPRDFAAVTEPMWREAVAQDWVLASGDYLGQLQRWLAVFPRAQFYAGFYESITERPEALLRDVFRFLGVAADVDLSAFPVRQRVLPGIAAEPSPSLRQTLHQLLHERTVALARFLREQFDLVPPPAWQDTLQRGTTPWPSRPVPVVFARALEDGCLARVLAAEKTFPSACRALPDHRGYALYLRRGRYYALARSLPSFWPGDVDDAVLDSYRPSGHCFSAATLAGVKRCVDRHLVGTQPVRSWLAAGVSALRRAWCRLRAVLAGRGPSSAAGADAAAEKQAA